MNKKGKLAYKAFTSYMEFVKFVNENDIEIEKFSNNYSEYYLWYWTPNRKEI